MMSAKILQTCDTSWLNITLYWTWNVGQKVKTLFRQWTHKRPHKKPWCHHRWKLVVEVPYEYIIKQKSKYAGILNKLKNYLPLYVMRSLHFSMVGSALNYGLLTWGFTCSCLTKIQRRIIRTITCSKYNAHTEPLLKALDILKIKDTLKLNTLKFYYKYTHGPLPS